MTAKEIKTEIQKSMDKVPESVLKEVLEYHPRCPEFATQDATKTLKI